MIPLRLQIKNFLSYGSDLQTIDFTHHRLICLSGKNGHGKSALLDAITWVLWGQARKIGATSKPDMGVLRLGEVEMTVSFDFKFGKEKYRVRRDFSKKYGKPHAHLEFGILQDDDYFVSLTDKTMRKTQTKIEQTLGLDFETFVNSSFLRQGGANEFSKKSAKERKEVLGTILGLHHYDAARKITLEEIRTLTNETQHLQKLHSHTQTEFETLAKVPEEQELVQKELKSLDAETKEIQEKQETWQKNYQAFTDKLQKYKFVEHEIKQRSARQEEQRAQLQTTLSQWKATHKLILDLPDQAALKKEQQELASHVVKCQEALQKNLTTKEELLAQKETLTKLERGLEQKFLAEVQIERLALERVKTEKQAGLNLQTTLEKKQKLLSKEKETIQQEIEKLRKLIPPSLLVSDLEEQQALFERHKALYQQWVEQGNFVKNQLHELDHKQNLSQESSNPSCPLCEQNLSQARKRFLNKKFEGKAVTLTHRYKRLKMALEKLKPALHVHHKQLQQLKEVEALVKQQRETEKQSTVIEKELREIQKAGEEQERQLAKAASLLKELEEKGNKVKTENPEIASLTEKIKGLEKILLEVNYKGSEHKYLAEKLKDIESRLQQSEKLPAYRASQAERKSTIFNLCNTLKVLKREQAVAEKLWQKEKPAVDQEANLKKEATELTTHARKISEQRETLLQKKGTLEAHEKKRKELEKLQKEQAKKISLQATELHDLQQVSTALGKNGIQALLIEDAIPEIEQEANELLSRLTENQATISIESLRDLKKGGTRETLDINISDSNGIRPYELFSGGEAFRIDFALRIAISKLLARRAGTSLQTLIIDEGFGSQDEEGLNRIMDALYNVQDDFEKVIIVSHLTAMKEQFPVHFYIHKDPNGSKVTVIEHG